MSKLDIRIASIFLLCLLHMPSLILKIPMSIDFNFQLNYDGFSLIKLKASNFGTTLTLESLSISLITLILISNYCVLFMCLNSLISDSILNH